MKICSLTSISIQLLILVVGLGISCKGDVFRGSSSTDDRPNLILIIADDLGWNDLGCYGNPRIKTPHIDQLAEEGMCFDLAFLTTSSCSPSRASIITGKYPHQTNAEQLHWPLPADQVTFVEQLRKVGYWTGQAGKWHLGSAIKDRFNLVLDVSMGGFQLQQGNSMTAATNESGCEDWLSVLQARDPGKPFFLWLAAVDPHRDYRKGIISAPHQIDDVQVPPYLPDVDEVREDLALYYDEVSRLDSFVGIVVNELERQQVSENTLILFISDNGRPFPRDKTTLYDGGIKTPWIVKWPARISGVPRTNALVSAVDIAPTLLELAGAGPDPSFEGVSFLPVLKDPSARVRSLVYAEDHWHDFADFGRAVRSERFKYIKNFYDDLPNTPPADALRSQTFQTMRRLRDMGSLNEAQLQCFQSPRPKEELYDLNLDPYELLNLAQDPQYSDTLQQLRFAMEEIRRETGDSIPKYRTPDEFDRESGQPNQHRIRPRPSKAEMIEWIADKEQMQH